MTCLLNGRRQTSALWISLVLRFTLKVSHLNSGSICWQKLQQTMKAFHSEPFWHHPGVWMQEQASWSNVWATGCFCPAKADVLSVIKTRHSMSVHTKLSNRSCSTIRFSSVDLFCCSHPRSVSIVSDVTSGWPQPLLFVKEHELPWGLYDMTLKEQITIMTLFSCAFSLSSLSSFFFFFCCHFKCD